MWIPVTQGLPEVDKEVYVITFDPDYPTIVVVDRATCMNYGWDTGCVVAWRYYDENILIDLSAYEEEAYGFSADKAGQIFNAHYGIRFREELFDDSKTKKLGNAPRIPMTKEN